MSKRNLIFALIIGVLAASMPLFMDYLVDGHDLEFHLIRIEGIYEGIKNGIFPVKMQSLWFNDYGYPVGIFYGDWLLYIPAIFRLMGVSIQTSYQMFVFLVNIITIIVAYYCYKRLLKSENMGLVCAIVYTLSLYRLENIYSRAAVGEYCAMIFFPMILVGMYEILYEEEKHSRLSDKILLALGLTGVIHSHMLSCEMVAIFIFIACIICIKRVLKPHVFKNLCMVVVLTILLSLDFIIPFLDYYLQDYVLINSENWIWRMLDVQSLGLFFNQIFSVFINSSGQSYYTDAGVADEITISLGLPVIVGMIFYVFLFINSTKEQRKMYDFKLANYSFYMFLLAVFMSTCYFPWRIFSKMHEIFHSLISAIQFPWRFLTIASAFSVVFIAVTLRKFKENLTDGQKYLPVLAIVFSIIISVGSYSNSYVLDEISGENKYFYELADLNIDRFDAGEYLPESTDAKLLESDKVFVSENVQYSQYSKKGLTTECYVQSGNVEGYIEYPLLYYKGYVAYDKNNNINFDIILGKNNVIKVVVPPNYSGNMVVDFKEPVYWRIGETVTLLSIVGVILYILMSNKRMIAYEKK